MDIASIANQGFVYYQVTSNQGACEKCKEHNGAIYPIADAKEFETLPPFHPNCKCTIRGFSTKNPNHDPWLGETVLWLEIMYGDGTMEQKAQKIIDFYHWSEFSLQFIARMLTATEDISHIGKRIKGFFKLLDLAKDPIKITSEELERFGWSPATQEEADRLTAAFAANGITTRESAIEFMALAAAESGYGEKHLEIGSDSYFDERDYDKNERGAGYLQITWRNTHLAFLQSVSDGFDGPDTASYIAKNYPLEAAIWFWLHPEYGYHTGGINEFIETRLAKEDDVFLAYLKSAYYVAGFPNKGKYPDFNDDINDVIAGRISYKLTEDELIIRGRHYALPNRWEERLEAYEKAKEIW